MIRSPAAKITAHHSRISSFSPASAEVFRSRSLIQENSTGWWFSGSNLYQVVLQPFYEDLSRKRKFSGTVVVGRMLDSARASDLGRISSSHLIFPYGGTIVLSTFSPFT